MKSMDRRTFLKMAGAGYAAAAAAVALPIASLRVKDTGRLIFRATAGLPAKPLPAYAVQVVEGNLDLTRGTGVITSQIFAGHTEGISNIALPGLARVVRVTGVVRRGETIQVTGAIDDRAALARGESPVVEIFIDRARGIVTAPFVGNQVMLTLAR